MLEVSDLTFLVTMKVDSTYRRVYRLHLIDSHGAVVISHSYVGGYAFYCRPRDLLILTFSVFFLDVVHKYCYTTC